MENILVIGIAGGSGSGKTTLMRNLTEGFGDNITVLSHDNYYRAHDDLPFEQRSKLNYDHPDAFETDLMIEHLKQLKQGNAIQCPVYDYTIHNRTEETITVEPKRVIIVEGILIFENKALCDLMDIKIFVDTDADVRLIRRIKRDVAKRGRSLESVLNQYMSTVKPIHLNKRRHTILFLFRFLLKARLLPPVSGLSFPDAPELPAWIWNNRLYLPVP